MRSYLAFLLILICISPAYSSAEDFLGAPLPPQREIIKKTNSRLSFKTDLSHDAVVRYYKGALTRYQDIKFRDKQDSTYIEDHGKLTWHSITISKGDKDGATVLIAKDNWTWIRGPFTGEYFHAAVRGLIAICF